MPKYLPKYFISTFYKFQKDENPEKTKLYLEHIAKETDCRGLIIIGTEGFNATICAKTQESFNKFKAEICVYFKSPDLFFKDSASDLCPFRRFKVKVRDEIVTSAFPIPHDLKSGKTGRKGWGDQVVA